MTTTAEGAARPGRSPATTYLPRVRSPLVSWGPRADAQARLRSPRRALQVTLGMIWLLDAALQFQPFMFTPKFVHQVIVPSIRGNPGWIAATETWAAGMMAHHVVVSDAVFATAQLLLAAAILHPRTVKLGLAASIPWAIGVWWFGEGLGGILTGASPLAGAPGAVILYAFVAVAVWPAADSAGDGVSVATSGPAGRTLPRLAWLALWGSAAYFLLLGANSAPNSVSDLFAGAAGGEPGWVAGMDHTLASALAGGGGVVAVALAACCALVAVSMFVAVLARPGVVLAGVVGLCFWLAEDFGMIFTGRGTDPSSGLLLVLVAAAFWPVSGSLREPGAARHGPRPPSAQPLLHLHRP
jgi:hypothetical protein